MYNKVRILINDENTNECLVQAISIKKDKTDLLIPSPFGTETMAYDNVEEAIRAIKQSGYNYYIVNSKQTEMREVSVVNDAVNYSKIAEVFIKNLGHENLDIRNSAINSLSKFGVDIAYRLIEILQSNSGWLVQQSVIKCIEKIIASDDTAVLIFMDPLIEISETQNTLVKSAALKALEKICDKKHKQGN